MNHSKCNNEFLDTKNPSVLTLERKISLWWKKFWQFSLFYGDYLASLHSRKK